ncbi:hypothetical protein NEUTE2DRAFT_124710 [Neurospora tetrasperma FGSC 2509]|nr:hypothetical protein NEUTE2DRAFT_124710 [Neurospora tetrasperma FGSC 2509]
MGTRERGLPSGQRGRGMGERQSASFLHFDYLPTCTTYTPFNVNVVAPSLALGRFGWRECHAWKMLSEISKDPISKPVSHSTFLVAVNRDTALWTDEEWERAISQVATTARLDHPKRLSWWRNPYCVCMSFGLNIAAMQGLRLGAISKWFRANYLANNRKQLFATELDWFFSCRHTDLRQLLPPSPAQPQRRYSPPGHSPQSERTVCLVFDLTCESMCLEFSFMWDIVPWTCRKELMYHKEQHRMWRGSHLTPIPLGPVARLVLLRVSSVYTVLPAYEEIARLVRFWQGKGLCDARVCGSIEGMSVMLPKILSAERSWWVWLKGKECKGNSKLSRLALTCASVS